MGKRSRTIDQDKDLEEAREPQEMNLYDHLSSLYDSCNGENEEGANNNNNNTVIVPPNVIVKTSFKDFNVHEFAVKRSGLFRTMIDSNEQWKLGKVDDKFNIDLTSVEGSISTEGEPLKKKDFEIIFRYLYCDDFNCYMGTSTLKRIIDMAKYLDIPSLITKILDGIQFSLKYFPIKYSLKGELTEHEIVDLIFKLTNRFKNNYGEEVKGYSNELISYICQQQLVPLFIKVNLLQRHLTQNNKGFVITKEMLQPFSDCIKKMRKESKYLLPNQSENIDPTMFKLLELKQPKENPCKRKHYRCADTVYISMGAEEDSGEFDWNEREFPIERMKVSIVDYEKNRKGFLEISERLLDKDEKKVLDRKEMEELIEKVVEKFTNIDNNFMEELNKDLNERGLEIFSLN
ncbi:predicted protein, partial [Naegleria gruberi]